MYNVGRLGFCVRAQPTFCFGRNWHLLVYSATKTLAHLGKKYFSPILIKKNDSRRRPGNMTVRGLKKKHHRMTSVEHFLTDIMHISLRDWIENSIADISREVARLIFLSWHCAIVFWKRSLADYVFFFTAEEVILFWCCIKNVQCRPARFFCATSTAVLFWPKLACFHLFGLENISPSRQKDIFHRYWSKKMTIDVAQETWPIEVYKWWFTGWCRSNISLPTSCIFH